MILQFLTFRDLLECAIEIDGMHLDAKVDVVLRKTGRQELDINSLEIGDVFLVNDAHELVLLDQESLKTRNKLLYQRFVNAVELLAFRRAAATPEHKWEVVEDVEAV